MKKDAAGPVERDSAVLTIDGSHPCETRSQTEVESIKREGFIRETLRDSRVLGSGARHREPESLTDESDKDWVPILCPS
jgi:hypothetical protein